MEHEEIKKALDATQKAWNEFKAEADKGARASQEKLAKLEEALNKAEDERKAAALRLEKAERASDEMEKKLNRLSLGAQGERDNTAAERKATFLAFARYGKEEMHQKAGIEAKALIASDDTAGGVLAPPEYIKEIIKAEVLVSPMRSLVKVRPTSQRSASQPRRTQTAAATWVGETQTRSESQNPQYGGIEIPTHEMTAECYISFADLEDSVFDLEAELTEEFSEQFGVSEGAAVVVGNGKNKPLGLLDSSSGVSYTPSGVDASIADANGVADGLIDLFHAVKTAYAQRGQWIFNRKTLGAIRKLKDSQKRYIWEPSPAPGSPPTLLGAPYTEVPDMPDVASNAFPIGFGDLRRTYTMVDRISMAMLRDPYTKASVGQVKFVARRRVGGQVVLAEAFRVLKCSAS
jgi:HK97 family phage major capsid protein